MSSRNQVEEFLRTLKEKIKIFDIAYRNREKNLNALAALEITPVERNNYIKKLKVEDYYRGPIKDTENPLNPDYFEFGIIINGIETYIKINLGRENKRVDCISFHKAEMTINFPFKEKKI